MIRFIAFWAGLTLSFWTIAQRDSITFTTQKDTLNVNQNEDFKSKVTYKAKDSIIFEVDRKIIHLYKNVVVNYEDLELKSDYVLINYGENTVIAEGLPDSTGKIQGKPQMKDGDQVYYADKIIYNFKTRRGKVYQVRTQLDQDQFIQAEALKRSNEANGVYYIKNGKFTTCNAAQPHYYFLSKKMKVIPNDKVVTGPVQAHIEDVPLPIILPFGYFPNKPGGKSGILFPMYGESVQRGFFLRDGGYYFAISPKMDAAIRGDVYSKGGFGLRATTNYKIIQKLDGSFTADYQYVPKSKPEDIIQANEFKSFTVRWSHSQPLSPTARFTANVNAGTTNYNQTANNPEVNLVNTLQSSVSFSKSWTGKPYSFSANLTHSQNNATKNVTLGIPDINFSHSRINPFKSKNSVKSHWYDNIGIAYNATLRNQISGPDSIVFSSRSPRLFQHGVNHTIPIDANFKIFKYLTFTPTFTYQERWYTQQFIHSFDSVANTVVIDTLRGFYMLRSFNTGVSLNTALYGTKLFQKGRLMGIRHVILPNLSFNIVPDYSNSFWNYYGRYKNTAGVEVKYPKYNGIFGTVSSGRQQNISFNLNNTLDIKVKQKVLQNNETTYKPKNIPILEGFSVSGTYNLAADSLRLSPIAAAARTRILNVINLAANANFDPYQSDTSGRIRYNRLEISQWGWQKGRVARLVNAGLAVGIALSADLFKNKGNSTINTEAQYFYTTRYVDFDVAWTFTANYTLQYTQPGAPYTSNVSHQLNFSGDINLTPKWKIVGNSGFDFTQKRLSYTNLSFVRDLHCWELRFNWIPLGIYQSYTLEFNIKSSLLRDVKISRKRNWLDNYR
ncbi:MAG: putative LPS assembly protein LptD [Bacteroidia bacterium]|nr:putative LPS assembly protein LptD [Bacteroidia bacterium]